MANFTFLYQKTKAVNRLKLGIVIRNIFSSFKGGYLWYGCVINSKPRTSLITSLSLTPHYHVLQIVFFCEQQQQHNLYNIRHNLQEYSSKTFYKHRSI